jgi:hypothetical protein
MHIQKKLLIDKRAQRLAGLTFHPDQILTTEQLAEWLEVSTQFVKASRRTGLGPPFVRVDERNVRYRCGDVLEWLKARTYRSTAEYPAKLPNAQAPP